MKKEDNNLYSLHLKKTRDRITKDQNSFIEVLKDELVNQPYQGQTKEQKEKNKKRLLNYVHRYVFLQRLQPLDSYVDSVNKVVVETYRVKILFKYYLFFRNFIGNFFKLRSLLIILIAILIFFFEFFIHYFSLFSFSDLNITFQDIINKIPPFF